jgi:hypothetical protein
MVEVPALQRRENALMRSDRALHADASLLQAEFVSSRAPHELADELYENRVGATCDQL